MVESLSPPEAPVDASLSWRRRSFEARALATVLLPGTYAWGATVAWPAFAVPSGSALARVAASLAAVALLTGTWLARRHLRLGRAVGVLAFAGFSAATWGALDVGLRAPHLDPVRAALGAFGWGLFALGWGTFPGRTRLPEDDPHALVASRLPPRARLSLGINLGFAGLLVCALALPVLAWRVERAGVSLLAHAVALAGAVGLLSVGSRALLAPKVAGRVAPPRLWLALLVVWLLLGALGRLL